MARCWQSPIFSPSALPSPPAEMGRSMQRWIQGRSSLQSCHPRPSELEMRHASHFSPSARLLVDWVPARTERGNGATRQHGNTSRIFRSEEEVAAPSSSSQGLPSSFVSAFVLSRRVLGEAGKRVTNMSGISTRQSWLGKRCITYFVT